MSFSFRIFFKLVLFIIKQLAEGVPSAWTSSKELLTNY